MRIINEKNYGLEILRMILCFWVLCFHCLKESNNNIILSFKRKMFHVPSFFFISFYFLFPVIKSRNINKMRQRLIRLSISYIFWPLITFSFNNILFLLKIKSRYKRFLLLKELIMQWIFGRKFYVQFWFLFNLLLLTIFFFILSLSFSNKYFFIIIELFCVISYILQYSSYNYTFFDFYPDSISHSVGHFVETFPIAVFAFILYNIGLMNILLNCRYKSLLYSIIGNYFILKYEIFNTIEIYGKKYNYNGFDKNVFAILSFISFYLIPFDSQYLKKIKVFIKLISNYTQGIYCLHNITSYYSSHYLDLKRTFNGCIIIYLLSYIICFIGTKISFNTKMKYLFI